MPYEIGQQVIRQVSDGPRYGVVKGVIRHGSGTNYYVTTGVGMLRCDPGPRLRLAQTGDRGPART